MGQYAEGTKRVLWGGLRLNSLRRRRGIATVALECISTAVSGMTGKDFLTTVLPIVYA